MLDSWVRPVGKIALILALLWVVPAGAREPGGLAPIGDRLRSALAATGLAPDEGIRIRVSLRQDDLPPDTASRRSRVAARQERVLDVARPAGFQLRHRYGYVSGFSGLASARVIEALRRHPEVEAIHLDWVVRANLGQGGALIGSTAVHSLEFTGAGINVAVIDTGIDTDHPGLMDDLVAEQCYCDNHPSPSFGCCPGGGQIQSGAGAAEDDEGHGTNVSGVITSTFGVAPDSGIVAIKVLAANGSGFSSDVDAALDWVVLNHATYDIRVVNMSLGDSGQHNNPNSSACNGTPTDTAIEALTLAGVVTFAASGNNGHDNGISEPACVADAISVGGVYDASVGNVSWCGTTCGTILCTDNGTQADDFVCHTNSDEILDLLAPDWKTTTSALGGGSLNFGGTSAASPYAAAQAALLLQADPTQTPADIRTRMKAFGPMVTNSDNGLSFRRTDVELAIQDLLPPVCGDSVVEGGEDCDDGNTAGGDCCSETCQYETMGSSCEDGDLCTTVDVCNGAGTCAGAPTVCDDTNVCTDDSCNEGTGACDFLPNTDPCEDGDLCTTVDVCDGAGTCAGAPTVCDDTNVCTDDSCNAGTGVCDFLPNTDPCEDGDLCTTVDVCDGAGACAGAPVVCDDTNVCTDDSCNAGTGACDFLPNTASCADGDACTDSDVCASGVCTSGPLLDCDDANPCTADACDMISGCTNTNIIGCHAEVPASGAAGRMVLAWLALCVGVAALRVQALRRRPALRE